MKRATAGLFVLLIGLAYAALPASASAAIASGSQPDGMPKVLRVGTEGVYPPFSFHDADNQLTGFDIDVMNAVGKRLGVTVEYVETPFDSMFAALQSDRFDIVANQITFNEERDQLYDLSDPYVETTGVLVVRKDEKSIKTIADLKGKRAAENLTSNWAEVAKDAGATIVSVDDMSLAITNLEQGRVDALVNDQLAIQNYLATKPNAGSRWLPRRTT